MFLLQQKIYVIKKKATYKKVFLLMSCLWVLEKWCHPIITLEFLDPQNIWKKKLKKKNSWNFFYILPWELCLNFSVNFFKMRPRFSLVIPTFEHQIIHLIWCSLGRWHPITRIQHFSGFCICHTFNKRNYENKSTKKISKKSENSKFLKVQSFWKFEVFQNSRVL